VLPERQELTVQSVQRVRQVRREPMELQALLEQLEPQAQQELMVR